jgi:hypothetical protein
LISIIHQPYHFYGCWTLQQQQQGFIIEIFHGIKNTEQSVIAHTDTVLVANATVFTDVTYFVFTPFSTSIIAQNFKSQNSLGSL